MDFYYSSHATKLHVLLVLILGICCRAQPQDAGDIDAFSNDFFNSLCNKDIEDAPWNFDIPSAVASLQCEVTSSVDTVMHILITMATSTDNPGCTTQILVFNDPNSDVGEPLMNVSKCTEQGMVTEYAMTVGNKVKFEVQGQNMTHGLVSMQVMITPIKDQCNTDTQICEKGILNNPLDECLCTFFINCSAYTDSGLVTKCVEHPTQFNNQKCDAATGKDKEFQSLYYFCEVIGPRRCEQGGPDYQLDGLCALVLGTAANWTAATTPPTHQQSTDTSGSATGPIVVGVLLAVLIVGVVVLVGIAYAKKRGFIFGNQSPAHSTSIRYQTQTSTFGVTGDDSFTKFTNEKDAPIYDNDLPTNPSNRPTNQYSNINDDVVTVVT